MDYQKVSTFSAKKTGAVDKKLSGGINQDLKATGPGGTGADKKVAKAIQAESKAETSAVTASSVASNESPSFRFPYFYTSGC